MSLSIKFTPVAEPKPRTNGGMLTKIFASVRLRISRLARSSKAAADSLAVVRSAQGFKPMNKRATPWLPFKPVTALTVLTSGCCKK